MTLIMDDQRGFERETSADVQILWGVRKMRLRMGPIRLALLYL
jgi:hypothetical protein